MIRKWDITDERVKKRCLEEIIAKVGEDDDIDIGMIAAQEILDIVSEYVGPNAYNMAIEDARRIVHAKAADLDVDFDVSKMTS